MRKEQIEIYSDASNAAIMRHPGRRFPGVLVQGDTLQSMKGRAERVITALDPEADEDIYYKMMDILDWLTSLSDHYKGTLKKHKLDIPF